MCVKAESLPGRLQRREWLFSLFFLTAFPYIRSKLEDLAVKYQFEEADGIAPQNVRIIISLMYNIIQIYICV